MFVTAGNSKNSRFFRVLSRCASWRLGEIAWTIGKSEVLFAKFRVQDFDCHSTVGTIASLIGGRIGYQVLLSKLALNLGEGLA